MDYRLNAGISVADRHLSKGSNLLKFFETTFNIAPNHLNSCFLKKRLCISPLAGPCGLLQLSFQLEGVANGQHTF